MALSLSIILPTFNEAGNIGQLIKTIYRQSGLKDYQLEIVVVDDNSPDGTAAAARRLSRSYPVKVIVRIKQRGLATAILAGIRHARGRIIVLMDTDFNHQPKDIIRLVNPIASGRSDLVIGSRYIAGGGMPLSEAGPIQFLGSKWGNWAVNKLILNLPVSESLSGFVAIRSKVLRLVPIKSIFQGYGDYCMRLLYHVHREGLKINEVAVVYGKRRYGVSKSQLLSMFFGYFKTALSLRLFPSRPRA